MANCGFINGFSDGFEVCDLGDPAPGSGIEASGIVIESPQLDPLFAIRPEGEPIRMLREISRQARKQLRGG